MTRKSKNPGPARPVVEVVRANPELILLQYDHYAVGADEFRDKVLIEINRDRAKLNVEEAYYYDDAIWMHGHRPFTMAQIGMITLLVQFCIQGHRGE